MSKERETDQEVDLERDDQHQPDDDEGGVEVERDGETVTVKEPTESRRERRERQRREERAAEMDSRINPIMEQMNELKRMLQAQQTRQPIQQLQQTRQEEKQDELDAEKIYDRMVDIQTELNSAAPEQQTKLAREYRTLSLKLSEVQARKVVAEQMKHMPQPQQQYRQEFDPVAAAEQVELNRQYSDVLQHPKALTYAKLLLDAARAAGEVNPSNSLEVQLDCCKRAAEKFKLRGGPAPTGAQRARFGGGSSAPAGNGGGGYKLSARSVEMAISANPGLPEDKAIAKWVKDMRAAGLKESDL